MKAVINLRTLAAVVMVMAGASVALGVGITSIGTLTPMAGENASSKIYAISADGTYAVGESNGTDIAGTTALTQAVVWSAANGLVQLPNTVDLPMVEQNASARGVVVKANGEVGIAAYHNNFPVSVEYRMYHYTASPSNLAGGTWLRSPGTNNLVIGTYNAARNHDIGGTLGNVWAVSGQRSNSSRGVFSVSTGGYSDSNAPSGNFDIWNSSSRVVQGGDRGYSVGYRRVGSTSPRRAIFGASHAPAFIPGGAGYQSEALGISPYTTTVAGSGVVVGYDEDTTANHNAHAFFFTPGASSMTLLPEPAGAVGSQAIDVKVVNGQMLIAGFATDGTAEQAVIWDKSGTWTPNTSGAGQVLSTLLSQAGVNMSNWASLSRVTSMSDDGRTVAGWGVWAADGTTRGFIATIPEPASLLLLCCGGLAMLRRNRR